MRLQSMLKATVMPVAVLAACQGDVTSSGGSTEAPVTISVSPSAATVAGGKTLRLTARVQGEDGSYSNPFDVTWSTGDDGIASVDATGGVQGVGAGEVRIVATWHGSHGSSLVTVTDAVAGKPAYPCATLPEAQYSIPPGKGCKPR